MNDQQPERPKRILASIAAGFEYPDAFMLYHYRCTNHHVHRIWNSRNGCVPFIIGCPSCNAEAQHIGRDAFDPFYVPAPGEYFFRDCTAEEARASAWARVARWWEDEMFPMSRTFDSREEAIEMIAEDVMKDTCSRSTVVQATGPELTQIREQRDERWKDPILGSGLEAIGYRGSPMRASWLEGEGPDSNHFYQPGPSPLEQRAMEQLREPFEQKQQQIMQSMHDSSAALDATLRAIYPRQELRILLPDGIDAGNIRIRTRPEAGERIDVELSWNGGELEAWKLHHPRRGHVTADLRVRILEAKPEDWVEEPR